MTLSLSVQLKRWVERGKEDEAANDPGSAPPPTAAMLGGSGGSMTSATSALPPLPSSTSVPGQK